MIVALVALGTKMRIPCVMRGVVDSDAGRRLKEEAAAGRTTAEGSVYFGSLSCSRCIVSQQGVGSLPGMEAPLGRPALVDVVAVANVR
ncbi:unnamed protein product [Heligmosomoides polygyrus]|uniref:MOSC domain-containing protein n=1 Tax=Heligmosomoides polygyrus TaxID=6339 RepID=A0A183FX26_HELPZ|nr:unnamed protein product [Heligmosomoides polygyrus]